jgi:hypothetical protein
MEKESPGKESMEEDHWGGLGLKRLLHQGRRRKLALNFRTEEHNIGHRNTIPRAVYTKFRKINASRRINNI